MEGNTQRNETWSVGSLCVHGRECGAAMKGKQTRNGHPPSRVCLLVIKTPLHAHFYDSTSME